MAHKKQNSGGSVKIPMVDDESEKEQRKFIGHLIQAIKEDDLQRCTEELKKNFDVNDLGKYRNDQKVIHPLLLAAKLGRCEITKLLLRHGAKINTQNRKRLSALHFALSSHRVECSILLLKEGIDVTLVDINGNLPLHTVSQEGKNDSCEVFKYLLEKYAVLNPRNNDGRTPLHFAANTNANFVKLLLEAGNSWDVEDKEKNLPLHRAAFYGKADSCTALLDASGDRYNDHINYVNEHHHTPLIIAAKRGHAKCCEALENSNIDAADKNGNTALHFAAVDGYSHTMKALLTIKPKTLPKNKDGNTPIHKLIINYGKLNESDYALKKRYFNTLKALVSYYSYANPGINLSKKTVIHLLLIKRWVEGLMLILEHPSYLGYVDVNGKKEYSINCKEDSGLTALHIALEWKNIEVIQKLISIKSLDRTITNKDGDTPLHIAVRGGMLEFSKLLLKYDRTALKIKDKEGRLPLHLAVIDGSLDCCKIVISESADIGTLDNAAFSPFHLAAKYGRLEMLELFSKRGDFADALVSTTGDTSLHLAAKGGHPECCDFLMKIVKKETLNKQNGDFRTPLQEAFINEKDSTFDVILSRMPHEIPPESENRLKFDLHEFMESALDNTRREIQMSVVNSKRWYAGFSSEFCGKGRCPNLVELIKKNATLAEAVFDKCIKTGNNDTKFNFKLLENYYYCPLEDQTIPHMKRSSAFDDSSGELKDNAVQFEDKNDHPLSVAIENGHLRIMRHLLTETYLTYKWEAYVKLIVSANVFFEFLVSLIFGLYLNYVWNMSFLKTSILMNATDENLCSELGSLDQTENSDGLVITALFTVLVVLWSVMVYVETMLCRKVHNTLFTIGTTVRILRIIGICIAAFPVNSCFVHVVHVKDTWQWQFGIIFLLLSWFHLLNTLNGIHSLSVFMPLTLKFLKSFAKVVFYIFLILLIFAFIFHLLLREEKAFSKFPMALVKTLVWFLGDFSFDDVFLKDNLQFPVMTTVFFVLLVTSVTGFIVHLFITQPLDQLQYFKDRSVFHYYACRIYLILNFDSISSSLKKKYTIGIYKHVPKRMPSLYVRFLKAMGLKLFFETFNYNYVKDDEEPTHENVKDVHEQNMLEKLEQINQQIGELATYITGLSERIKNVENSLLHSENRQASTNLI